MYGKVCEEQEAKWTLRYLGNKFISSLLQTVKMSTDEHKRKNTLKVRE